jgi:hypothetical protein
MAKLTTRTLATGASLNDLIHIVITGDTSQSVDGSSYKASLSQLVPLFGGSPDVFTTGGTSNSSGGTITFTNSTGGTFTVSGLTTPFTGGSGNCITSFYTENIHACVDEITVHNRVQSVGSDAQGTLSFAFGDNVEAVGNYSHAEGGETQAIGIFSHAEGTNTIASGITSHAEGEATLALGNASHAEGTTTIAIGDYSHAEGYRTLAGTNKGYLATGLTAGVIYLSSSYGDITTEYTSDDYVYINDVSYANTLTETYRKVSGATFNGSETIIYLYDISTSTTSFAVVGNTGPVSIWNGDQNVGGYVSNTKGSNAAALGDFSMAVNETNNALSKSTFAQGKANTVFGINSCVFNNNNYVVGTSSVSFGDSNVVEGDISFIIGSSNEINSNYAFAGGDDNINNGTYSFIFSKQSTINNSQGAILGGIFNLIQSGDTDNSTILGGINNSISGLTPSDQVYDSSIIGGSGNTVQSFSSVIVGGEGNTLIGGRSVVLGGIGISATASDTAYAPNLVLAFSGTPTSSLDLVGEPGSLLWDDSYFYYKDNTGWKRLSGATF